MLQKKYSSIQFLLLHVFFTTITFVPLVILMLLFPQTSHNIIFFPIAVFIIHFIIELASISFCGHVKRTMGDSPTYQRTITLIITGEHTLINIGYLLAFVSLIKNY